MAATEAAERRGRTASYSDTRLARGDETKNALSARGGAADEADFRQVEEAQEDLGTR